MLTQSDYKRRIEHHRQEKDALFARGHHSPLSHDDRPDFKGLKYFSVKEDLVFNLEIQEYSDKHFHLPNQAL